MSKVNSRNELRKKRHIRNRAKVYGTLECPRLTVFKSLKQIYVQLVNDEEGRTLLASSTLSKDFKSASKTKSNSNIDAAKELGKIIVEKIKEKRIEKIRFDRSGYKYHGGVKALADAIRDGGIIF
ncbi:MAG: 50S ribosomal protein L18 [bacterium]|nr:50S ribosomal protein L18 [bacterium]